MNKNLAKGDGLGDINPENMGDPTINAVEAVISGLNDLIERLNEEERLSLAKLLQDPNFGQSNLSEQPSSPGISEIVNLLLQIKGANPKMFSEVTKRLNLTT